MRGSNRPHRASFGGVVLAGVGVVFFSVTVAGCTANEPFSPASSSAQAGSSVVAYVGGRAIAQSELESSLLEAQGRSILEELILSALVQQRLDGAGLSLLPAEVSAERARLLEALGNDEDEAERLLTELRERRGLGPQRFDRLLRRNAGLRKLVASSIEIGDAAVRRAFDRSHGRRYRVRLLAADSPERAKALRNRVLAGESFAEVAAEASIDSSRDRGGLLDPVHPADPTFPPAIRAAVEKLAPGELSDVIALQSGFGYAVVQLDSVLPADRVAFQDEESAIRETLRADLERLRMEQLARTLRAQSEVVILDPRLQERSDAPRP